MAKDKESEATKDDEQKYSLRMPKDVHRELRILTVTNGLSMNSVINEAIVRWMEAYKAEKTKTTSEEASHP